MQPENEIEANDSDQQVTSSHRMERLVMPLFTRGPWKADGYNVRQNGQGGTRMVADVCYTGPHHTPPDEYPKSCRLADEANAALIAQSPRLWNALNNILQAMPDLDEFENGDGIPMRELVNEARAAVLDSLGHNANMEAPPRKTPNQEQG